LFVIRLFAGFCRGVSIENLDSSVFTALLDRAVRGTAFRNAVAQKGLPKPADAGKWGIDARFDRGACRILADGSIFS
jgi:hypothetical protein